MKIIFFVCSELMMIVWGFFEVGSVVRKSMKLVVMMVWKRWLWRKWMYACWRYGDCIKWLAEALNGDGDGGLRASL